MKPIFIISFLCLFLFPLCAQTTVADTVRVNETNIEAVYRKPQRHIVTINRDADIRFTIWDNTVEMWAGSYNLFTGRYSQLLIDGISTTDAKKQYLLDSFYVSANYSSGGASSPDTWDYATSYDFFQTTTSGSITGTDTYKWSITNTGSANGTLIIPGSTSVVFRPGDTMEWSAFRDTNSGLLASPPDVAYNATGTEFTISITNK